jgi:hypothetical protein
VQSLGPDHLDLHHSPASYLKSVCFTFLTCKIPAPSWGIKLVGSYKHLAFTYSKQYMLTIFIIIEIVVILARAVEGILYQTHPYLSPTSFV